MIRRLGVLVWFSALVSAAGPALAADGPQPNIEFERERVKLGTVPDTETVRVSYRVRNTGTAPLDISDLRTSCGCLAALNAASHLEPGDAGDIVVTLDPTRIAEFRTHTIRVYSNDPDRSVAFLKLVVDVDRDVWLSDPLVAFGKVKAGTPHEHQLIVFHDADRPVELASVSAASELLGFSWEHALDYEKGAYVITVRLGAGASPGLFADTIRIRLAGDRNREFEVPVRATVLGPVVAEPAVLGLGILRPDESAARQVRISAPTLKAFRVEKVESTSAHMIPRVERLPGSAGGYRVAVHLGPDVPKGQFQAALRVYTSARDQPLLEIPVIAIVR